MRRIYEAEEFTVPYTPLRADGMTISLSFRDPFQASVPCWKHGIARSIEQWRMNRTQDDNAVVGGTITSFSILVAICAWLTLTLAVGFWCLDMIGRWI